METITVVSGDPRDMKVMEQEDLRLPIWEKTEGNRRYLLDMATKMKKACPQTWG